MTRILRAAATLLLFSPPAFGEITWQWSFDQERGTFQTSGSVADLGAAGQFEVQQFTVSGSTDADNIGASFSGQANQFIVWEPSAVESFRAGTGIPFGSAILFNSTLARYTFATDSFGTLTGQYRVLADEAGALPLPLTINPIVVAPMPIVQPVPATSPVALAILVFTLALLGLKTTGRSGAPS